MESNVSRFISPGRLYFGQGASSKLEEALRQYRVKKVFVATDRGVQKAGLVDVLLKHIEASGSEAVLYDDTEAEPTVDSVGRATRELVKVGRVDMVVSLGGGSVMDVAKCANVLASNGGSILDYEDGKKEPRKVRRLMPHIAVPTTAGTGSEATTWAVFTDPKRRYKTAIQDERLVANVAILDPEMTKTMPRVVAASTGIDALTHAIEAYVSTYSNGFTDALCAQSIQLVAKSLRRAVKDPKDSGARSNMLLASYMAGSAFTNSSLGIVHTLAEAVGGFHRIPHGVTNALMLPHVMRFNAVKNPAKYADIAVLMGEDASGLKRRDAAELSASSVDELCRDIGLPSRLRDVGVKRKDFPALLDIADRWANLSGNPRRTTRKDLEGLYKEAF